MAHLLVALIHLVGKVAQPWFGAIIVTLIYKQIIREKINLPKLLEKMLCKNCK